MKGDLRYYLTVLVINIKRKHTSVQNHIHRPPNRYNCFIILFFKIMMSCCPNNGSFGFFIEITIQDLTQNLMESPEDKQNGYSYQIWGLQFSLWLNYIQTVRKSISNKLHKLEKETFCFLTWKLRTSEWVISDSFSSQVSCLDAENA